jgi:prepilin-type N-terminal cleavage/methylation domain-containing protein
LTNSSIALGRNNLSELYVKKRQLVTFIVTFRVSCAQNAIIPFNTIKISSACFLLEIMIMGTDPKGFTLLELLIVMAIIAVLAAMAFLAMANMRARAAESTMQADLKNFAIAMVTVRIACGSYSSASIAGGTGTGSATLSDCGSPQIITKSSNNSMFIQDAQITTYAICVQNPGARNDRQSVATKDMGGYGWGPDCPQAVASIL